MEHSWNHNLKIFYIKGPENENAGGILTLERNYSCAERKYFFTMFISVGISYSLHTSSASLEITSKMHLRGILILLFKEAAVLSRFFCD